MTMNLSPEEKRDVFGDVDPEQYADEARERWGNTEAYQESARRTARYGKAEWEQIKREAAENVAGFAEAFRAGAAADGEVAVGLAEAHRQHISRWFYDCPLEMHRGLGDMYVADPRFAANYDAQQPGLAQYVRDAVHANADRRS